MILRFLRLFLLSWSLKPCFFGPVFTGLAAGLEGCLLVSGEPVSIWTICLKEFVSAWMKDVLGNPWASDMDIAFGVDGFSTQLLVLLLSGEVFGYGLSSSRLFGLFSIDGGILTLPLLPLVFVGFFRG